jgi:hypothetical protein
VRLQKMKENRSSILVSHLLVAPMMIEGALFRREYPEPLQFKV